MGVKKDGKVEIPQDRAAAIRRPLAGNGWMAPYQRGDGSSSACVMP